MRELSDYVSRIETGLYRHYKGKDYRVFGTTTHSESEEILVLYAPVEGSGADRLWVRPLTMFNESVETESGLFPRFQRIDPA